MSNWIIGVDVGGTFTDFAARDLYSGETYVHKRLSTPDDPSQAILKGLDELQKIAEIPDNDIERIAHGTTVATNAMLQRKGAKVAVATTHGFRDLLEIGRQVRPKIYDLQEDASKVLANRENRLEIKERITSDGSVLLPISKTEISSFISNLENLKNIESLAICFLFSFLNPAHEKKLAAKIRKKKPNLYISVSSEVQPEFREYERFSTTLINAFLQPQVSRYMKRLSTAISKKTPRAQFGIFQSSGGLMSIDTASAFPVRTALSGPAAGVIGAVGTAALSGEKDILTLDMGGTSTDVCLIENGRAAISNMQEIAGFRIRLPMLDIKTVGAGGGSIASIGRDGLMKVGPESAGASPGPACYNLGGKEPTVTDANVFLGRLPEALAGGSLKLDKARASIVIEKIASQLGISAVRAALGIVGIVNSNMTRAIRAVSVERGYDPRKFTLMPFGGAGGLHAPDVARSLEIKKIFIPNSPGILCAEGLIEADLQENFVRTCRTPLVGAMPKIQKVVKELYDIAQKWQQKEATNATLSGNILSLDMRYIGQNYELPVDIYNGLDTPNTFNESVMKEVFLEKHKQNYGHADPDAAIEIINARLKINASLPKSKKLEYSTSKKFEPIGFSEVWFTANTPKLTPVFKRSELIPASNLSGPAIIIQLDATTVVPPGASVSIDGASNLTIEIDNA